MIEVKYQSGQTHNIEIRKAERIESDGTYLIHGKENGLNVILHVQKTDNGKYIKIPRNSAEYMALIRPSVKKIDVTNEFKALDKEEPKERRGLFSSFGDNNIKIYIDKKGALFITAKLAAKFGFIKKEEIPYYKAYSYDGSAKNVPNYQLKIGDFEQIKRNNVVKFIPLQYEILVSINIPKEPLRSEDLPHEVIHMPAPKTQDDEMREIVKNRITKLLIDIRYYLENEEQVDDQTKTLIRGALARNKMISMLANSNYKDNLLKILYFDLMDIQSSCHGLNLSSDRTKNYTEKIHALYEILDYRGKGLDVTPVKELFKNIEYYQNECVRYDGILEPRVWFMVEKFTNDLIDKILISDDTAFKELMNTYNKDNLLYGQIIHELNNHLLGSQGVK